MPVIVESENAHPFLPSLSDPAAIEAGRARRQDIRPLEIAIVNLMADKQAAERQLAFWLGNTPLQVQLTFAATDEYIHSVRAGREPINTPGDHIRKFYKSWSDIRNRTFDGLIVTGVNALKPTVAEEEIWPAVREILRWSDTNVFSSLFLCWGAKAALRHFHNIESRRTERKLWGVFEHRIISDQTGILTGFPDSFPVPVARWKSPKREDIAACAALEIVADSPESGPNILAEPGWADGLPYQQRVYVLNHPEYETETLRQEYLRDHAKGAATHLPSHYFPDGDANRAPVNTWRHTAHIYTNWIKAIYETTPFDIGEIPYVK